jgi:rod shape-determining protein MreD
MAIDTLKRMALFFVFCLVQALVLNHIHLFGWATPLLYVYFAITFPRNYPRWAILLWCFVLGLSIDMFSNTPGLACASLTAVGFLQPYLLEPFIPRDAAENIETSARALGRGKFTMLSAILVLFYCLLFFTLEAFTFFNWQNWLLCIGSSTLITLLLIMTLESLRRS